VHDYVSNIDAVETPSSSSAGKRLTGYKTKKFFNRISTGTGRKGLRRAYAFCWKDYLRNDRDQCVCGVQQANRSETVWPSPAILLAPLPNKGPSPVTDQLPTGRAIKA
jgi:hypothetical protein